MKIIHWNCQGAFRKKCNQVLNHNPDILIISECEEPSKIKFPEMNNSPTDYFWYGDNPNRGIGFYFFNSVSFKINNSFNSNFRYIIPLKITSPNYEFNLFGIWAMGDSKNRKERYIGQVWKAVSYYKELLSKPSILIGDFNSNKIWDKKPRVGNHSDVVNLLTESKIESLYHKQNCLDHGKENNPTFFLHRNKEKPYHIDYCFASESLIKNGYIFEVGKYEDWIEFSDHVPIITELIER